MEAGRTMTPAELGSRLIALSESGQLTAGVGSAAIADTRREMETLATCRAVAKLAGSLAYYCELRTRSRTDESREAAERQIRSAVTELASVAESFTVGKPRIAAG